MSSQHTTASAPDYRTAERDTRKDGFFTHHGIWAPGVRLFRKLDFKLKAGFISLAFLIPSIENFVPMEPGLRFTLVTLGLALALYLFVCFYKVMVGGLNEVKIQLDAMAHGDLTAPPQPWGRDEIAQLMNNLGAMQGALAQVVAHVRHESDTIVHASREITADTMDLSSRTEQTVKNLHETTRTMEQIATSVKSTAEFTERAAGIATENAAVAAEGGRIIAEVEATMKRIDEASRKISAIIGVIDGIAFQTNILALNAAVEAARAGEQGRGFAVVASEVRALAQRSATAAREIKDLIGVNVEEVSGGTHIAHNAGEAINALVDKARVINEIMSDVARSTQQQSHDIEHVSASVADLDHLTHLNTAVVSASTSAADSLKQAAFALSERVVTFKLPETALAVEPVVATAGQESVEDFDFDAAIEAHKAWKMKLRRAISNREQLDIATVSRDDCCALGKWIHGPGGHRHGHHARFGDLRDKHRSFHQSVGEIARKINLGRHDDAERLLGSGSSFTAMSTDVVSVLNRFKREVASGGRTAASARKAA